MKLLSKSIKSEDIIAYYEITSKYMNSSFKCDKDEEFQTFQNGEMRISKLHSKQHYPGNGNVNKQTNKQFRPKLKNQ